MKELKGIMETAERESEQKYAALEQQYRDLQVCCVYLARIALYLFPHGFTFYTKNLLPNSRLYVRCLVTLFLILPSLPR